MPREARAWYRLSLVLIILSLLPTPLTHIDGLHNPPPSRPAGDPDATEQVPPSLSGKGARGLGPTFTTTLGIPGVDLSPAAQEGAGRPGTTVTYALTATNTGPQEDTFFLGVSSPWPAVVSPTKTLLSGGASGHLTATVAIPPFTSAGSAARTLVVAISHSDPTVTGTALLTTTAVASPTVTLSPFAQEGCGRPGGVVTYTLVLTNAGNLTDTFSLTLSTTWPAALVPLSLTLPMAGSAQLTLCVAIPEGTPAGASDRAHITATSGLEPTVQAVAYVTTRYAQVWWTYLPLVMKDQTSWAQPKSR